MHNRTEITDMHATQQIYSFGFVLFYNNGGGGGGGGEGGDDILGRIASLEGG